jgi:tryptophan synthase beta chain
MVDRTRFMLGEEQIPKAWYNISADLPVAQAPPLHPGTHQPWVRRISRRSSLWA